MVVNPKSEIKYPQSFQGITALVTGASSGLGEDFARQLAAQGAHLILVARNQEKLQQLARELSQACGVQAHVFVSDLSREKAPRELYEAVTQQKLHVDLLINNAGFGRVGGFEKGEPETDQAMVSVNISSLVALTHLFLKPMLERGKGGILNVASTAAFQPLTNLSTYAATKAFVLNFTEALWGEYEPRGIRILCYCPGYTRTDFHRRAGHSKKGAFHMAESADVVRYGLNVFQKRNCPTAVYGFKNRMLTEVHRMLPRECVIRIIRCLYRPVR